MYPTAQKEYSDGLGGAAWMVKVLGDVAVREEQLWLEQEEQLHSPRLVCFWFQQHDDLEQLFN